MRTNSAIAAILSDRINWVRRPQEDDLYPACALSVVGKARRYHYKGQANVYFSRVQVDVWGETYTEAKAAIRAFSDLLSLYSGVHAGIDFRRITMENERDLMDQEADSNKHLFRETADLEIWHKKGT